MARTTRHLPPGPRLWPWLGNSLTFGRDPLRFVTETQRRYGRMATVFLGKRPLVLCFEPEHVRYL